MKKQNDFTESSRSKVPMSNRLSFFSNVAILSGFILMITTLLTGGTIGAAFPMNIAIPILLSATLTVAILAILIGAIATRTGYSTPLMYRFSFGSVGVILPVLIVGFAGLGWVALSINLVRDSFSGMFGVAPQSGIWWFVTIGTFILFVIPAFKSVKWLSYLNWVAVPSIILILIFVFYYAVVEDPGVWTRTYIPELSVMTGVSIAMGNWMHGTAVIADFTRFIKDSKHTALAIAVSFGALVLFQFLGGAVGAAITGDWNIFNILATMGVASIGFLGLFFSAWTTCSASLYGSSIQLSAPPIPRIKDQETTRKFMFVLLAILTFIGVLIGIERFIMWYLPFISFLIAPIVITVIIDYWILTKRRILYEEGSPDMRFNPAAYLAWLLGFITGNYTNSIEFGSGGINALVVAGLVYYVWMQLAFSRNTTPERQLGLVKTTGMSENVEIKKGV